MNLLLKSFGLDLLFWAAVAGFVALVAGLSAGTSWLLTACPRPLAYYIVAAVMLAFTTFVVYTHKKVMS